MDDVTGLVLAAEQFVDEHEAGERSEELRTALSLLSRCAAHLRIYKRALDAHATVRGGSMKLPGLRQRRLDLRLGQSLCAGMLGTTRGTWYGWENGSCGVSPDTAARIAKALKTTVKQLTSGTEDDDE